MARRKQSPDVTEEPEAEPAFARAERRSVSRQFGVRGGKGRFGRAGKRGRGRRAKRGAE
jgi:hypothetical protein